MAAWMHMARRLWGRVPWALWQVGLYRPEDRRVLEHVIIPHYRGHGPFGRVLLVGVAAYTRHYHRMFAPQQEIVTIDSNPRRARYGGPSHIVDRVEDLGAHFPPAHFSLIVMNGVIGWGLDDISAVDRAITVCHRHLSARGELILSTDGTRACHGRLGEVSSLQAGFSPFPLAAFSGSTAVAAVPWQADSDHVFFCFRRRE